MTTIKNAHESANKGIYLWTIELPDGYLTNYVGKTSAKTGFYGRLCQELNDWKNGLYRSGDFDLDHLAQGRRIRLENPPADHLQRELDRLMPLYRLFLAPLDSHVPHIRYVESYLVNELRRSSRTFDYLSNRDKKSAYKPRHDGPPIRISADSPRLIGFEHLRVTPTMG
jgi:hypothetical protein